MQLDSLSEINEEVILKPAFARHETFHPRYGWLKKGFDAVARDPQIFNREDAPVILGVGKNMVRAIRYWCLAFKILEDDQEHKGSLKITEFGNSLLSEPEGFDPFIEDVATLWLLHWKLVSPPCHATAWFYAFNDFPRIRFSTKELLVGLSEYVEENFPKHRLAQSSLKKDVSCISRMYGKPKDVSTVKEDTIDSPFTELGLIRPGVDKDHFRFNVGAKLNLPEALIVSCCLEFIGVNYSEIRTASINNLLYSPGSPGMVFRLDEQSLYGAIEILSTKIETISLSETAGLIQLSFDDSPSVLAEKLLADYYQGRL